MPEATSCWGRGRPRKNQPPPPILDFWPPELWENKFYWVSCPIRGPLARGH